MDERNKTENKPSWDHINTDLKGALDTWDELTDKMANKISPEEEQLREIKTILGTLKDKLKAFEDEEPAATAPAAPEKTADKSTENPTDRPADSKP